MRQPHRLQHRFNRCGRSPLDAPHNRLTTLISQADSTADLLAAGWNGLLVALNALVVAVGFLLPWLGLIAVAILVVWLIRRRRRGRTRARVAEVPTED